MIKENSMNSNNQLALNSGHNYETVASGQENQPDLSRRGGDNNLNIPVSVIEIFRGSEIFGS